MLNDFTHKMNRPLFNSVAVAGVLVVLAAGCESSEPVFHPPPQNLQTNAASADISSPSGVSTGTNGPASDSLKLREGDTVHIEFPGAPSLNSTQVIRRDGKITLNMVGEIKAVGLTPQGLEKELLKDYDSQLVVKQVSVTVQSSVFSIYITGAVMRPGELTSEHVLSPLEALIQAGIDHNRANLKAITVIRPKKDGINEHYTINVQKILRGKPSTPFTLQPGDVIYVHEKFSWY